MCYCERKTAILDWSSNPHQSLCQLSWVRFLQISIPRNHFRKVDLIWLLYEFSKAQYVKKKKTLKLQWALQLSHIINTLRSLTCSREILMLSVEQMNWSTSQAPRPLTLYLDTWLHFSWFSSSQLSWHCEDWITCQPLNVLPFCEDCWSLGDYKTV